ncbi:putative C6 transcription factor [Aspergillus foveolatus]|uniref:putative C6 transcription factor n=1 Tax=Aspergillus foveolatus TaxID=210207 RepID=UPI003CCD7D7E
MVEAARSKAATGLDSGVRKFTLSCSRCRASKLKCDRKEPCVECIKRNIGHLCTKDERHPRAKRSKTEHKDKTASRQDRPPNEDGEAEAEKTAQLLEQFVQGDSRPDTYLSAPRGQAPPSVAPDFANRYWSSNDPKRDGEKLALIREIVDAMPDMEMIHHLFEVFVTRCQGPLMNVVHTPTFAKQAEQFSNCLNLGSVDSHVSAIAKTVTMETLGCYLLALVLGLAFHPTPSLLGWTATPLNLRVEELRASNTCSQRWRPLSLRCLQDGVTFFCGSIAGLQAAIMLLLDGQEDPLVLDAVLVTAISGARKLGLHRLGDINLDVSESQSAQLENGTSAPVESLHVRTEIGVRIWWALVHRDWSRGQALGYYTVRPSQFNTRVPLHVNDEDLIPSRSGGNVNGKIVERPRSEFTMMSYTVHAIELGGIVRESIDLWGLSTQQPQGTTESAKFRKFLNSKYEKYVAGLPPYFRLGSTAGLTATGTVAAVPVQRWMLHQQLWSLLLRLYRAGLASPLGRASCQLLAQNIISTQAQIQMRCAVCGSLSTSETQLFSAAVVLLLDLLFTSRQGDADCANAHLNRLMTRDKIREAIELLRTKASKEVSSLQDLHSGQARGSAHRSVVALEALLKIEEGNRNRDSATDSSCDAVNYAGGILAAKGSLIIEVANILRALSGRTDPAGAPAHEQRATFDPLLPFDMSIPSANVADESSDMDVLPILSNGLSPDFWQFLDLPQPYDFHTMDVSSTLGDLPGPFGLGSLQLAGSYSSAPVTRITHTSPSSTDSAPLEAGGCSDSVNDSLLR